MSKQFENERCIFMQLTTQVGDELDKMKGKEKWSTFFLTAIDEKYGTNLIQLFKESQIKFKGKK